MKEVWERVERLGFHGRCDFCWRVLGPRSWCWRSGDRFECNGCRKEGFRAEQARQEADFQLRVRLPLWDRRVWGVEQVQVLDSALPGPSPLLGPDAFVAQDFELRLFPAGQNLTATATAQDALP